MASVFNTIVRTLTFSIGLLILVFLLNSAGLDFLPDIFYSVTGAFILVGVLLFGAFWLE